MLGISDFWVWGAYLFCVLGTALCVGYGIIKWNKEGEHEGLDIAEEAEWEAREELD